MPGTIRISVLDIIDLPSPSPPPSSMSIKVSVGKREYQRAQLGDLSIPLTTLRENLIVKLLDDAGNEISRAGVETRSIIEKGIWDELFPLEGGGKMHLKMQFILSEEEQSRIRMMRLSALKKKHGELVTNSPRGQEKNFERNFTASLSLHPISRSSSLEGESGHSILASRAANLHGDGSGNTKAITERKVEVSSAEEHSSKVLDKTETQPRQSKDINRGGGGSNGENASSSLPSNQPTTAAKASPNTEMRIERTPSNVRKMISVFETSLAHQDTRPSIKPPPIKLKSSTSGIMAPDQAVKSKKSVQQKGIISITPLNSKAPESERIISERVREIGRSDSKEESVSGCVSGRSPDDESCRDSSMKQAPESERIISERSVRDIVVVVSGRSLDDESCRDSFSARKYVGKEESSSAEEDLTKAVDIQSDEERILSSYRENEEERSGGGGGWIFLEEPNDYYCATALGKQAIITVERHSREAASVSRGSNQENRGKNTTRLRKSSGPEANRVEKNSHKQRRSKIDGSVDSSGGGPLGQVVKIAIMVGFGALVLFTRQRKDR